MKSIQNSKPSLEELELKRFYSVDKVDGNFFTIETLTLKGDEIVSRTKDESDYLAVKLSMLKHNLFGRFYFGDKE